MPSIGPVIVDLIGPELSSEEHELLQHPLVGGVILFTRHYQSPSQITELCKSIRAARSRPILITVDHEGGRVQRFREGFTRIPNMGHLGKLYETSQDTAIKLAETCGWLIASELLSVSIDLSFTPVLDLNIKNNPAIGDRSFHSTPEIVIELASALIRGLHSAGMIATGKHFPGHGSVTVDSHLGLPIDTRSFDEIKKADMQPFAKLIQTGIDAIMPAHILFPAVDNQPVGFSKYWLQEILRSQLKFSGIIFSDDLNMKGADVPSGGYANRARAALEAGCDMVLICNNRPGALEILNQLPPDRYQVTNEKFKKLQGKFSTTSFELLKSTQTWQEKHDFLINYSTQEIS